MPHCARLVSNCKDNGLGPGETLRVAFRADPQGPIRLVGHAAPRLLALDPPPSESHSSRAEPVDRAHAYFRYRTTQPSPALDRYPRGSVILALSEERVLVYQLNLLGQPRTLAVSYRLNELRDATHWVDGPGLLLRLAFADGGAICHRVGSRQRASAIAFAENVPYPH